MKITSKVNEEESVNMNNIETKGNSITISRTHCYDLTQLITQEMPVYPGDPQPEFKPIATVEKEKVKLPV